ncbi:HK97 gp10 family phage protein [Phyllobacterium salinisoli]|uniref:HK97 gp10 family phage protein n=1 Tax=Phyllobacterium salinisoli TaxID=1899321 RepID=A0A368JYD7_9HYPH|nr:HK97-gp10 family putative phage morphogenesis protein [Phyllobacterium salinisoli]RCS21465.1 HK97 gp10 family phage protein [Phyllobacterium salinisoli]
MATNNGLAAVEKRMRAVVQAARAAAKLAMAQGADEIVAMMKSLVAVDKGDLRDSIGWTWGDAPKYSQRVGAVKSSAGDLVITIYAGNSKVRYAHLVEFGSAPHINGGMFPGTQNPGTPARPFFFVSYRTNKKRAKSRITRAVKKAAKDAFNGN